MTLLKALWAYQIGGVRLPYLILANEIRGLIFTLPAWLALLGHHR